MKQARSEEPQEELSPELLADLISLTGTVIPAGVIATWTERERAQAAEWASAVHLSASDNTGVRWPAKPPVVLAAEEVAANPAVAQILVEQWTALLEHAERAPEVYAGRGAQAVMGTARAAVTALLVLAEPGSRWQGQALRVLREHHGGLREVDLFALLGRAAPPRQELSGWLVAGEDAGTVEEILPGLWRARTGP